MAGPKAKSKPRRRPASARTGNTTAKPAKKAAKRSRPAAKKKGIELVAVDRRRRAAKPGAGDRRGQQDRREKAEVATPERRKLERRKPVNRRRQIDPTTCERDYTADEIEFMNALDEYKRKSGRMFPTCSEVLEVIKELGYAKASSDNRPLVTVGG